MTIYSQIDMVTVSTQSSFSSINTASSVSTQSSQSSTTSKSPSAQDVKAFEDIMDKDEVQQDDGAPAMPSMASIMAQMGSTLGTQGAGLGALEVTSLAGAASLSMQEMDALTTMMADRILLSDPKAHMVTVEISLADLALPGTTVQLTRSLDGLLAVNLMTHDAAAFQTLVAAQAELKIKLEAVETGFVRVDVYHGDEQQSGKQQQRRDDVFYGAEDDGEPNQRS